MSFIRLKKVAGKRYAYLVENTWSKKGPRQSVAKYLGKYQEFQVSEINQKTSGANDTTSLIKQELIAVGFSDKLVLGNIKINLQTCTIREGKKPLVLGLNGGYLCDYTLRKLLHFQPIEEITPGYRLARAFSDAGIRISRAEFVAIYKKAYKPKNVSTA